MKNVTQVIEENKKLQERIVEIEETKGDAAKIVDLSAKIAALETQIGQEREAHKRDVEAGYDKITKLREEIAVLKKHLEIKSQEVKDLTQEVSRLDKLVSRKTLVGSDINVAPRQKETPVPVTSAVAASSKGAIDALISKAKKPSEDTKKESEEGDAGKAE